MKKNLMRLGVARAGIINNTKSIEFIYLLVFYFINMKRLILLLLIVPLFSFGQKYYVSAEGGLNVRILPELNTTKVGSLMYK